MFFPDFSNALPDGAKLPVFRHAATIYILYYEATAYEYHFEAIMKPTTLHRGKQLAMVIGSVSIFCLVSLPAPANPSGQRHYLKGSADAKLVTWMQKGIQATRQKLKDPKSAEFRQVYFRKTSLPMTCGEVNSKNSFGAYGGYQRFISAGRVSATFLEEEVRDFDKLWGQLC